MNSWGNLRRSAIQFPDGQSNWEYFSPSAASDRFTEIKRHLLKRIRSPKIRLREL